MTAPDHTLESRFWMRVNKDGPIVTHVDGIDACWVWAGMRDKRGYGFLYVGGAKKVLAHRFSWELANGEISSGMHVLHRCDNPNCIRPSHLFVGTHADNMRDMASKGRARSGGCRGSGYNRAVLDEASVAVVMAQLAEGIPTGQVARNFGVSRGAILAISIGRTWTHVPWPEGASLSIERSPHFDWKAHKRGTHAA
jgi:hypothetical protein